MKIELKVQRESLEDQMISNMSKAKMLNSIDPSQWTPCHAPFSCIAYLQICEFDAIPE